MLVTVGVAALVVAVRTRQLRMPWTSTLAAVAGAVGALAWVLLDALDVDVSTIAIIIAPFLLGMVGLFLVGRLREARGAFAALRGDAAGTED